MQNKGPAERSTLCVNGWLSLSRRRYHSRHAGTMTPSDDLLDATGDLISLGTRQLCCQLNRGAHSFEMATQNLLEAARLSLSAEKLRQVVEAEGRAVLALSHGGDLQPVWNASQLSDGQRKNPRLHEQRRLHGTHHHRAGEKGTPKESAGTA
jgi:hypothetical protein